MATTSRGVAVTCPYCQCAKVRQIPDGRETPNAIRSCQSCGARAVYTVTERDSPMARMKMHTEYWQWKRGYRKSIPPS